MRTGKKDIRSMFGFGLLLLVIILFSYKFIAWNFWKLETTLKTLRLISNAPPAVNLAVFQGDTLLFRQSFVYNKKGNYYIINRFNIDRLSLPAHDQLRVTVNRRPPKSLKWSSFQEFKILQAGEHYFVFIQPGCSIDTFAHLVNTIPHVIGSL